METSGIPTHALLKSLLVIFLCSIAASFVPIEGRASAAVAPTLSVSPAKPRVGERVLVNWNAGSASGCVVLITDVNRSEYAPWGLAHSGSAHGTFYTNTILTMRCLDSSGGYVTPTPSLEVRVEPALWLSKYTVTSGETIDVMWEPGPAHGCVVKLSDATRTGYAPWGLVVGQSSGKVAITSNTVFGMTCLDTAGNYVTPTPSATARLAACTEGYALAGGTCVQTPRTRVLALLAALNTQRAASWASNHSPWEIFWNADGDPAHGFPSWQWWNQPYSDDWEQPGIGAYSFAYDTPSPGFFTIDRTAPENAHKPSLIVRYDELLGLASGLTLEFRAKIMPNSDTDAFNVIYSMGGPGTPTLELFLSPNKIIAGGMNEQRVNLNPPTAAFNTTDWHTYRMVVPPGENRVHLYVDGNTTPILSAPGNFHKPNFLASDDVPYIMVGGHFANRPVHAIIDFVRYRRGAYSPAVSLPAAPVRTPPPLPSSASSNATVSWSTILDGTRHPADLGYKIWNDTTAEHRAASNAAWKVQSGGILEFNSVTAPLTKGIQLQFDGAPGLAGSYPRGPYTIELRAKVLPSTTERGFGFTMFDAATGFSVVLSPNKVETYMGWKPAGYQTHYMDTTDGFHTYRFVHPDKSTFGYLYIDDNPVPVLVDSPGSDDGWFKHHWLQLGTLTTSDLTKFETLAGHVLIDYFRVSPTAYAPALP